MGAALALTLVLALAPADASAESGPAIQSGSATVSGTSVLLTGSVETAGRAAEYSFLYGLLDGFPGEASFSAPSPLPAAGGYQAIHTTVRALAPGVYDWEIHAWFTAPISPTTISSPFVFTILGPTPPPTLALLRGPSAHGNRVALTVVCRGRGGSCGLAVTLRASGEVVGRLTDSLAAPGQATLLIPFNQAGRKLRARHRRLAVAVEVSVLSGSLELPQRTISFS